jgi:hypothetical protein
LTSAPFFLYPQSALRSMSDKEQLLAMGFEAARVDCAWVLLDRRRHRVRRGGRLQAGSSA